MSKRSFNTSASMESDLQKVRCQFQETPKKRPSGRLLTTNA